MGNHVCGQQANNRLIHTIKIYDLTASCSEELAFAVMLCIMRGMVDRCRRCSSHSTSFSIDAGVLAIKYI